MPWLFCLNDEAGAAPFRQGQAASRWRYHASLDRMAPPPTEAGEADKARGEREHSPFDGNAGDDNELQTIRFAADPSL